MSDFNERREDIGRDRTDPNAGYAILRCGERSYAIHLRALRVLAFSIAVDAEDEEQRGWQCQLMDAANDILEEAETGRTGDEVC